ncbi:hypothetical protein BOTBODRAFT_35751 [Botryobasidium botryosum FD-172 SS1]|uniref:Uncharacterized protein n=1 Tax=Botryobasidium botryosum (strain FD-172 SS1) TaxID=930990 RepID=A0A067M611_BOTB1|nr:hypothetical protein BOTBODRAFT_35751 [Botryobasidium botryosum FD-172 SS1]
MSGNSSKAPSLVAQTFTSLGTAYRTAGLWSSFNVQVQSDTGTRILRTVRELTNKADRVRSRATRAWVVRGKRSLFKLLTLEDV